MPVTVVVGGQFGSEGKGKVAHYFARELKASVAIRCGGPNSGHTVIDPAGKPVIFQQLPTASILPDILIVLCAGMYIDLEILYREIETAKLSPERLLIDPNAIIITPEMKEAEKNCGLVKSIGSTGSGTGEALIRRIKRRKDTLFAKEIQSLSIYIKDAKTILRNNLKSKNRVILEGTQGFGLSLLHSKFYPYVTSRDTSAAGFLSEAGLSPLDVDQVILTIRAFPIRVGGDSGPLPNEIDWNTVTCEGSHKRKIEEKTTVTKRLRRVARFDPQIVLDAISTNNPNTIILNHLDYICEKSLENGGKIVDDFVKKVEMSIQKRIDYLGFNPEKIERNNKGRIISIEANHGR